MKMKLRVWHIPNPPCEAFRFEVKDLDHAMRVLDAIAEYDLFLGDGEYGTTSADDRKKKREQLNQKFKLEAVLLNQYQNYLGYELNIWANVQGLEVFEDGEWVEYIDEEGNSITDLRLQKDLEEGL